MYVSQPNPLPLSPLTHSYRTQPSSRWCSFCGQISRQNTPSVVTDDSPCCSHNTAPCDTSCPDGLSLPRSLHSLQLQSHTRTTSSLTTLIDRSICSSGHLSQVCQLTEFVHDIDYYTLCNVRIYHKTQNQHDHTCVN